MILEDSSQTKVSELTLSSSSYLQQIICETASLSDRTHQTSDELHTPSSTRFRQSSEEFHLISEERQSEQKLDSKKDSQLLQYLDEFRKKQIVLEKYNEEIKNAFQNKSFKRCTFLGQTKNSKEQISNDQIDSQHEISNLTKEEQIEDAEIKAQFITSADSARKAPQLNVDIAEDLERLCVMYLNGFSKLKNTLPSANIEKRTYMKMVLLFKTLAGSSKPYDGSIVTDAIPIRGTQAGLSNRSFQHNSNNLYASTSARASSASGNDVSRSSSLVSNQSLHTSSMSIGQEKQAPRQPDHTWEPTQCLPRLTRVDQLADAEAQQLWQEFATEIQTNSAVSSEIVAVAMKQGYDEERTGAPGYDIRHRTMLVNLSHLFLDNIHAEERLAFAETNNYLRFFSQFAATQITHDKFARDALNNVIINDGALRDTLMCLFEGLTRKTPSFNYLRFVFSGTFTKISMFMINEDLDKINGKGLHSSSRSTVQVQKAKPQEPQVEGKKEEEKNWFKKQWNKIFKDKEKAKEEEKKVLGPDDMEFEAASTRIDQLKESQQGTRESQKLKEISVHQSLAVVYGGEVLPFPPPQNDETRLRRFEEIENQIQRVQENKHCFLMDEYPKFQAKVADRINVSEKDLKQLKQPSISTSNRTAGAVVLRDKVKEIKNLTYHVKDLVKKNFEQVLNFMNKIPFSIRAMMKILILKSRGITDFKTKIKIVDDEIRMLANFIIAGWLNTGYRNSKCFGIQPSVEKELELEYIFFQASRITFEHMMLLQKIPAWEQLQIQEFDIHELNEFISQMRTQVFVFWIRLIDVDISEIETIPKTQLVESSIIRIDDLELLYLYSEELYKQINFDGMIGQKKIEPTNLSKWSSFSRIMGSLNVIARLESYSEFDPDFEKPLIPLENATRHELTLSRHFTQLLGLPSLLPENEHEYYYLFLKRKSEKVIIEEISQWQRSSYEDIKKYNSEFVDKKLTFSFSIVQQIQQLQQDDSSSTMLNRIKSMKEKRDEKIINSRTIAGLSQQVLIDKHFSQEKQDLRLVKIHQLHKEELPVSQVEGMLINIYNSLRVLLRDSRFVVECLRDQCNRDEVKDLCELLLSADKAERGQTHPSTAIKVGCKHIVRMIHKMNLQGHFELQNKILTHFLKIIDRQIQAARRYLDQMIVNVDTLGFDVEKFEYNVFCMKYLYQRYESNLKFMKTVSRYNPEVCFYESFDFPFDKEDTVYRGLLLNFACVTHNTDLPMGSYMLFGVISQDAAEAMRAKRMQIEIVSANELTTRRVRDKRVTRFKNHYRTHKETLQRLQNPNEPICCEVLKIKALQDKKNGIKQKKKDPKDQEKNPMDDFDKEIKLIEAFIKFFEVNYSRKLKNLVRMDNEKYKEIIRQKLFVIDEKEYPKQEDQIEFLRTKEPLDYCNMVKTYTMFLQYVSLLSSNSLKDTFNENYQEQGEFWIYQHYDFLRNDLAAKQLRYNLHDYIMKRLNKVLFLPKNAKELEIDVRVQKLILKKSNHPDWVITSEESKRLAESGVDTKDFTNKIEWLDSGIYLHSLRLLMKLVEAETPHQKALLIDEAVNSALQSMRLAKPWIKSFEIGENERDRVMKHLILEISKIWDKIGANARLYSQLLTVLLFDLPQNEHITYRIMNKNVQIQKEQQRPDLRDFTKLKYEDQHELMLEEFKRRYKAGEWFIILQNLIQEEEIPRKEFAKQNTQVQTQSLTHISQQENSLKNQKLNQPQSQLR